MAWTVVETPNARYVLVFSLHDQTAEKAPEQFDALVLEQGGLKPEVLVKGIQFENVVKQAIEQGKQIWLTDAPITARSYIRFTVGALSFFATMPAGAALLKSAKKEKIRRRAFIKGAVALGLLSQVPLLFARFQLQLHKKKIKHLKAWKVSTRIDDLIRGAGISTARNLITAEKCESFLAPKLRQELGRKPTIAMVWHPGHYGIRDLLLHPEERARLLRKYDLKKFVRADYPKSWRIKLKPDGTIGEIKEFSETLRIKKPKAEQAKPLQTTEMLTRRAFLAQLLRRKRL